MVKKFIICVFLIVIALCGNLYAQAPYNDNETSKLRAFLLQESAEPGVKNYQQLGISDMDDINWGIVSGLNFQQYTNLLEELKWTGRKLAGDLDISGFQILRNVQCAANELNSINVTGSLAIINLDIYENNFQTLDLTTNVNLEQICFKYNYLTEIDLSQNKKLSFLVCTGNQLETLDLSGLERLETLYCVQNNITSLNLTDCKQLRYLWCMYNNLTSLDVSGKLQLREMSCSDNNISDLRIMNCDFLDSINCSHNNLKSIDFSGCVELRSINCTKNILDNIIIDDCLKLEDLYCNDNILNSLTLPESPVIKTLYCKNNFLDFSSLPKLSFENVNYIYHPQYIREIESDINHVDLSAFYEIDGYLSKYIWTDYKTLIRPEIVENGVFSFDESLNNKQLTCKIENGTFPKLVIQYEVIVTNDDVANARPEKNETFAYSSDGYIHIKASSAGEARFYSLQGALLMTKNVEQGLNNIPAKQGVYVVTINNGKGYKLIVR